MTNHPRPWQELRAFARIELGLTLAELDTLTPAQLQPFIRAWQQKQHRTDTRIALILTQTTNTLLAVHGSKQTLKLEQFLPRKPPTKKMNNTQLLARARALFPPPKK